MFSLNFYVMAQVALFMGNDYSTPFSSSVSQLRQETFPDQILHLLVVGHFRSLLHEGLVYIPPYNFNCPFIYLYSYTLDLL